jgi:hypothetical protein
VVAISGHGLSLRLERGWEARIWVPKAAPPAENFPIVHMSNFALPIERDTYAESVVTDLKPALVMSAMAEFSPRLAGRGLYRDRGLPQIRVADLGPRAVQRAMPGRLGLQRFFTMGGRPFSLYVIAREGPGLRTAIEELRRNLASLEVDAV